MQRRIQNPSVKTLSWVAENFPPGVFYYTLAAFGEAVALHRLSKDALDAAEDDHESLRPFPAKWVKAKAFMVGDPRQKKLVQKLLRETKKAMKASPNQALRSGNTIYDRSLPWVAGVFAEMAKTTLDGLREYAGDVMNDTEDDPRWQPTTRDPSDGSTGARVAADWWALRTVASGTVTDTTQAHFLLSLPERLLGVTYYDRDHPFRVGLREVDTLLDERFNHWVLPTVESFGYIARWAYETDAKLIDSDTGRLMPFEEAQTKAEEYWGTTDPKAIEQMLADPTGQKVYEWPDGWHVSELLTERDLSIEGRVMANCIDEYSEANLVRHGGEIQLFSLRSPNGRIAGTMEWTEEDQAMTQARAFANKRPGFPELLRMFEFYRRYGPLSENRDGSARQVRCRGGRALGAGVSHSCRASLSDHWVGRFVLASGKQIDIFGEYAYEAEDVENDITTISDAYEWFAQYVRQREDQADPDDENEHGELEALRDELNDHCTLDMAEYHPNDYYDIAECNGATRSEPRSIGLDKADESELAWAWFLADEPGVGGRPVNDGDDELRDYLLEYERSDNFKVRRCEGSVPFGTYVMPDVNVVYFRDVDGRVIRETPFRIDDAWARKQIREGRVAPSYEVLPGRSVVVYSKQGRPIYDPE